MKTFDQKFGKIFLSQTPTLPGVYFVYDSADTLLYVGKAKNLRRRLSQYKNAKRIKKHRKMKLIVQKASRIMTETCTSELEASLLEIKLIQKLKPRLNVAGAYSFLYPYFGVQSLQDQSLTLAFSTDSQDIAEFKLFGAFRSRRISKEAYLALYRLLGYVGHAETKRSRLKARKKYTLVRSLRRIPREFSESIELFLLGKSPFLLEQLALHLLENAGARNEAQQVQEDLRHLRRFYNFECKSLAKILSTLNISEYPVSQHDRDQLWIRYRGRDHQNSGTTA